MKTLDIWYKSNHPKQIKANVTLCKLHILLTKLFFDQCIMKCFICTLHISAPFRVKVSPTSPILSSWIVLQISILTPVHSFSIWKWWNYWTCITRNTLMYGAKMLLQQHCLGSSNFFFQTKSWGRFCICNSKRYLKITHVQHTFNNFIILVTVFW